MYYLNDQHKEYEYCCYIKIGDAVPYISPRTFDSFDEVLRFIESIEKENNRYHRVFYIDNEFYENNYSPAQKGRYYKFLRRKVLDWEEFYLNEKEKWTQNVIHFHA